MLKNLFIMGLIGVSLADVKPAKDTRVPRQYVSYDDSKIGEYALVDVATLPLDNYPAPSNQPRPKAGFSVGGGLVSIARGSADQARTAVANQHSAAGQAAFVAKNQLAQSAQQSAATASAALAGKQIIFMGLQQQVRDAKTALDGEKQQMVQAARAAQAAKNSAQQAMHQVQVITAALNAAQATQDHAAQAAAEAAAELAAQTGMVGQAKSRLHALEEQLESARIDFEATQSATNKATAAAQLAQNNAAAAAAHAAESAAAVSPLPSVAEEEEGPAEQSAHLQIGSIEDYEEPSNHESIVQTPVQYSDEQEQSAIIYRNALQQPASDNSQQSYGSPYEQPETYGDYKTYY
ncbi:cell surface antigen I/II-like [Aphidius gifuensis]|uniref:cell surface antigen I/II-like n=1 Tax=Aphidius gifuensis TaxID=684658 RepID=UPI001CDC4852|nr:cell surface antigen I/II-like [Aphidius gifuensis]